MNLIGEKLDSLRHLSALLVTIAVGIHLRLACLFQPMRNDEAYNFLRFVRSGFDSIIFDYSSPNNHIFHTLLVRLTYLLLGAEPWKIRLPAFIAGVLIIPLTYAFFRLFYNRHVALLAAGLVATSPMLIDFSTNARGYTLITLLFLMILTLGILYVRCESFYIRLILVILSAFGFYTVPIFLYPFGIFCLWYFLLAYKADLNRFKNANFILTFVIATGVLTFILYSPLIVRSGIKPLVGNPTVASLPWDMFFTKIIFSCKLNWELITGVTLISLNSFLRPEFFFPFFSIKG